MKKMRHVYGLSVLAIATTFSLCSMAYSAERVTLANGFAFDCHRQELRGDKLRLYLYSPNAAHVDENYIDVAVAAVVRIEAIPEPTPVAAPTMHAATRGQQPNQQPTPGELRELISRAGTQHHIDAELLASVVHAESGGSARAVSRTGARGLMQLMPATALAVGVTDAFAADQNVEGGTRYLDHLLLRYHDNIALALAAYNAGPGAVDRFGGVPPFRETRAYVARVIREFNRRKTTLLAQSRR